VPNYIATTYFGHGFLKIDFVDGGKTLVAKFSNNIGVIKDQFNITKSDSQKVNYQFEPNLALLGSDFDDIANNGSLQLSTFSIAAWFRNPSNDIISETYIINKAGNGSDDGRNMNYGIWMTSSEKIRAGFETKLGSNYYVTSGYSFNDSRWHYAILTYDDLALRLYVDGVEVASNLSMHSILVICFRHRYETQIR
jgi:hypothetical protein